jgi:hypothetical protein
MIAANSLRQRMPKYKRGSTGMTKDNKDAKMTNAEFVNFQLFQHQHTALLRYMQVMIERNDWHGVSDVANDLRVLEAEYRAGK